MYTAHSAKGFEISWRYEELMSNLFEEIIICTCAATPSALEARRVLSITEWACGEFERGAKLL